MMRYVITFSALSLVVACTDSPPSNSMAETKGSAGETTTVARANVAPEVRPSLAAMTSAGSGSTSGLPPAGAATYGAAFTNPASQPTAASQPVAPAGTPSKPLSGQSKKDTAPPPIH